MLTTQPTLSRVKTQASISIAQDIRYSCVVYTQAERRDHKKNG